MAKIIPLQNRRSRKIFSNINYIQKQLPDVVVQLFPGLVFEEGPDPLPVEAAVTSSRPVLVLDAVVEGEAENLGGVVECSPVVDCHVLGLVRQSSAVQSLP